MKGFLSHVWDNHDSYHDRERNTEDQENSKGHPYDRQGFLKAVKLAEEVMLQVVAAMNERSEERGEEQSNEQKS